LAPAAGFSATKWPCAKGAGEEPRRSALCSSRAGAAVGRQRAAGSGARGRAARPRAFFLVGAVEVPPTVPSRCGAVCVVVLAIIGCASLLTYDRPVLTRTMGTVGYSRCYSWYYVLRPVLWALVRCYGFIMGPCGGYNLCCTGYNWLYPNQPGGGRQLRVRGDGRGVWRGSWVGGGGGVIYRPRKAQSPGRFWS
jgi:hypothetical protein